MRCDMGAGSSAGQIWRRITKIVAPFAVVGGLLLAFSPHGWGEDQPSAAEALLRRTATAYQTLQAYQDETTVLIAVTAQGMQQKMETRHRVSVQRPNKLALVLESGMRGVTLVSDGDKMYTYMPALKKFTVQEAPKSIEAILNESVLGTGMAGGVGVTILRLFGDDPYGRIMERVQTVELIGEEILEGAQAHHVLSHEKAGDVEMWIDAQDYLIKRIRIDMSRAMQRHQETMPGLADMKMVFEETHRQVRTGSSIPQDAFVFQPPAGAEATDDLFGGIRPGGTQASPLTGKQAPDFTLERLKPGTSFHLDQCKGKVVVLDFWASWCPPCHEELPVLQKLYDLYKEKDLIFIAVNSQEERETVQKFVADRGYTFAVALDTEGTVSNLYRVEGLPTLLLIDKEGTVRTVHAGFAPGLEKSLRQELDNLLAGKSLAEN